MTERFDDIIREYIDFVNAQVGVYMDAMAGFEGIKVKIERQTHRISRQSGVKIGERGESVVVWSSYEDPAQPDIIHNRIMRAAEYLAANSRGGKNEQQHSQAIVVFLVAYWEHSIRPRLANAKGVQLNEIKSNVMGDLTIARNAILHSKGSINPKERKRLKALAQMFEREGEIFIAYDNMHKLFYSIKQDIARLLFDELGVKDAHLSPDQLRDLAIERRHCERG
jgi:hypothetical protein